VFKWHVPLMEPTTTIYKSEDPKIQCLKVLIGVKMRCLSHLSDCSKPNVNDSAGSFHDSTLGSQKKNCIDDED
jgi:hypothetical protein